MPNWCANDLFVYGDKEQRDEFMSQLKVSDRTGDIEIIESLIPMPEGVEDWYSWALDNWGTKWGDCHTQCGDQGGDLIHFHFDTAWSPPLAAVVKISSMFPYLKFVLFYEEGGMCFKGFATFANGKMVMSDEGKLIPDADDIDWVLDETIELSAGGYDVD